MQIKNLLITSFKLERIWIIGTIRRKLKRKKRKKQKEYTHVVFEE